MARRLLCRPAGLRMRTSSRSWLGSARGRYRCQGWLAEAAPRQRPRHCAWNGWAQAPLRRHSGYSRKVPYTSSAPLTRAPCQFRVVAGRLQSGASPSPRPASFSHAVVLNPPKFPKTSNPTCPAGLPLTSQVGGSHRQLQGCSGGGQHGRQWPPRRGQRRAARAEPATGHRHAVLVGPGGAAVCGGGGGGRGSRGWVVLGVEAKVRSAQQSCPAVTCLEAPKGSCLAQSPHTAVPLQVGAAHAVAVSGAQLLQAG